MKKIIIFTIIAVIILMALNTIKICDVVETYDNTMVIETKNGFETLCFNSMTESEELATRVVFFSGNYIKAF